MKRVGAIVVLASLALSGNAGANEAQASFSAPYAGSAIYQGDSWNRASADAATGDVYLVRANPVPGSFGCGGQAGSAYLRSADVTLTDDVTSIGFSYADAASSAYAWFKVALREKVSSDPATYVHIATGSLRGPVAGSGSFTYDLLPEQKAVALAGKVVRLEVGVETSSACPNVDGGILTVAEMWLD